jgi:hypothetical protein
MDCVRTWYRCHVDQNWLVQLPSPSLPTTSFATPFSRTMPPLMKVASVLLHTWYGQLRNSGIALLVQLWTSLDHLHHRMNKNKRRRHLASVQYRWESGAWRVREDLSHSRSVWYVAFNYSYLLCTNHPLIPSQILLMSTQVASTTVGGVDFDRWAAALSSMPPSVVLIIRLISDL